MEARHRRDAGAGPDAATQVVVGMKRPRILQRADKNIRNLRLAGLRDFAVSGYADGLIVEQDMRGSLLEAADSLEETVRWIETELAKQ